MIIELTSKQCQTVLGWIGCGESLQFKPYISYLNVIGDTFYVGTGFNMDVTSVLDTFQEFRYTLREGLDVDYSYFTLFPMLEQVKEYSLKAAIVRRATSNRTAGSLVLLTLKELIQLSKSKEDASSMEKSLHYFLTKYFPGAFPNVKVIKDGKGLGIIINPTLEIILEHAAIEDYEMWKAQREVDFLMAD